MSTALQKPVPAFDASFDARHQQEAFMANRLQDEIRFLREKIASQAVLIEHLKRQAMEDPMTGLANRRAFERALEQALAYSRRYHRAGALLLIDVDDFKTVNDKLGHLAGDAILVHIARMLENHTRSSDLVARIGGDEFCIILREVDAGQARVKALQLVEMIEATPCRFEDKDMHVRVSIGACSFDEADSFTNLLEMADAKMYEDKNSNRNYAFKDAL